MKAKTKNNNAAVLVELFLQGYAADVNLATWRTERNGCAGRIVRRGTIPVRQLDAPENEAADFVIPATLVLGAPRRAGTHSRS